MEFDCCSKYYLENFQRDFMRNKQVNFIFDEKTPEQLQFEKYVRERGGLVIDYHRTIKERRYFEVLAKYMENTTKRPTVLYTTYTLSYIGTCCEFYSYHIPKKPTTIQFNNLYEYLLVHTCRDCFRCGEPNPYYYCLECATYTCRECVERDLRCVLVGRKELYYLPCRCGKWNVLYTLPSHYDF